MAPKICRELLNRRVATLRFLAQGHQNNIVQIASQALSELIRRAVADSAHSCRSDRRQIAVSEGHLARLGLPDCDAQTFWFEFANCLSNFVRCTSAGSVGPVSCKQFVEQHTEGIDIARRRDSIASDLLRAGIGGCQQPEYG